MLTPLLMFRLHPRPEVLLTRIGLYYPELTLAYAHPSLACATPLQGAPFIIHKVLSAVHIILEYRNILLPVAYGRRRPSPLSLNSLNRSMGWFQRISENISQKTLFFSHLWGVSGRTSSHFNPMSCLSHGLATEVCGFKLRAWLWRGSAKGFLLDLTTHKLAIGCNWYVMIWHFWSPFHSY